MTSPPDLWPLREEWEITLSGAGLAPGTVSLYMLGTRRYLEWCAETNRPAVIDARQTSAWLGAQLDSGAARTTIANKLTALRMFAEWLIREGEIDPPNVLLNVKRPRLDQQVIEPITREQAAAMLAQCDDIRDFRSVRDRALMLLMLDMGGRAREIIGMTVDDTDVRAGEAIIRRGKGGKGRTVPFSPVTAAAIARYLRKRRGHRLADTPALWLGTRNRGFGYDALYSMITNRAAAAGFHVHPHQFRHAFAGSWLGAGGTEGGAMAIAGWKDRRMIDRYAAAHREQRAKDEAQRLNHLSGW